MTAAPYQRARCTIAPLRPRLTYANVTSTLALFIAIGGVSYAATQLGPNTVGTVQLRNHAVTMPKLAASATRSLRLHCRRGTRAALGACFEPRERPAADFYLASGTCQSLGGRLPTIAEMEAATYVHGLLPEPPRLEMTGDGTFDAADGRPEYLAAPQIRELGFEPEFTGTPSPYRCVFAPSN
jgi:hypothetical protein